MVVFKAVGVGVREVPLGELFVTLFETNEDDGPMVNKTVRLPLSYLKKIDDIVKRTGRNEAFVIRTLLKAGLLVEEQGTARGKSKK